MNPPIRPPKTSSIRFVVPIVLILSIFLCVPSQAANIYYLDPNGTDDGAHGFGPGTDAWHTFLWALSNMTYPAELYVGPGTYTPPTDLFITGINGLTIKPTSGAGTAIVDGAVITGDIFSISTSSNIIIEGLVVRNCGTGSGFYVGDSSNIQIKGNDIHTNMYGIRIIDDDTLIQGNHIYNHNQPGGAGIKVENVAWDMAPQIEDNEINDNATGIVVSSMTATFDVSPVITRNKIHHNALSGIEVESVTGSTHPQIVANEIYQNIDSGIVVTSSADVASPDIWNNLIYSDGVTQDYGVSVFGSFGTCAPRIYHNTFDNNGLDGVNASGPAAQPDIRFNIFSNHSSNGIIVAAPALPSSDYNDYWQNTNNYGGIAVAGPHDLYQDPRYGSYSLLEDSPCIDAIPPTGAGDIVSKDYMGQDRPYGSGYDMGAYEMKPFDKGPYTVKVTLPPGDTVEAYRILAMPVEFADPSPVAIFGPQIGEYDTTQMRIGHWDSWLQAYMEYPGDNDSGVYPGDGAWFLFREGKTLVFEGMLAPTMLLPPNNEPYCRIPIHQGWNQVGNPYPFAIDLEGNKVLVGDGDTAPYYNLLDAAGNPVAANKFYVYSGGSYKTTTWLGVGQGGWIKKTSPGDGGIYFKRLASATQAAQSMIGLRSLAQGEEEPPLPPGSFNSGEAENGGCFLGHLF